MFNVVPIGHGFSFFGYGKVMEKSMLKKRGHPGWSYLPIATWSLLARELSTSNGSIFTVLLLTSFADDP